MLVKQTLNAMIKQIQKLEEQKKVYIEAGKQAKERGLTDQYNLALAGLRMTIAQQRRIYEMKLNLEITSQIRDMTTMTGEFLKSMGALSKDMMKISRDKEFLRVGKEFKAAMAEAEAQTKLLEGFMDTTKAEFESGAKVSESDASELDALMSVDELSVEDVESDMMSDVEKELEALKKEIG